jgi:ribosomal-protein-alanine N-acetyltransferase
VSFPFAPMTAEFAQTIVRWHYDGIYGFYDFNRDPEDWTELLDPRGWEGRYFAVLNAENELAGFFHFEPDGDTVEMGLGMRPEDTGKGFGGGFIRAGMDFARNRFHPKQFRLQVAVFNQRAIRAYEKLGFRKEKTCRNRTNGGEFEFAAMIREVENS